MADGEWRRRGARQRYVFWMNRNRMIGNINENHVLHQLGCDKGWYLRKIKLVDRLMRLLVIGMNMTQNRLRHIHSQAVSHRVIRCHRGTHCLSLYSPHVWTRIRNHGKLHEQHAEKCNQRSKKAAFS